MKKIIIIISLILTVSCSHDIVKETSDSPKIRYNIDVTDYSDDLFHVTVNVNNLTAQNSIYNMAATAPGTYQTLNFGRFVKTFSAFDKDGKMLNVEKISTNKWKIENPEKLNKIEYDIEDSFDAGVTEYPVAPMCGSGIENDFIAINTFSVLGYFEGLQTNPIELTLDYNPDWSIGTALPIKEGNIYYAETFDHLADSPILMGKLTFAETFVDDISVQTFVYSSDTSVTASKILGLAEDVLQSASGFIGYSPVKEYKFLMCLVDEETFIRNKLYGGGALEHSYSSFYVMPVNGEHLGGMRSTMAHEFLHILTPLYLHSEIIHTYNFETPTPSQHIWLYEGVTEWASDIMQLRGGLIDSDRYMELISQKLRMNEHFDSTLSLQEMALNSFSQSGYGSFLNFYERGAVTASLLDIRLLELSNGKKGLREVFLNLLEKYGKYKPFSEENFFDVFVEESYPEIKDFIDKYITGSESLPYKEYYKKIGYDYIPIRVSENSRPSIGTNVGMNDDMQLVTMGVNDEAKSWGLQDGDIILSLFDTQITMESVREIFGKISSMNVGDPFVLKVKRGEEEIEINGTLQQRMEKHIFVPIENLTEDQKKFREIWSKNL
ncbi:MAG: peptidase [Ignavibacteriales bacterium]|nr:peptidase [Ignavibacteriales bacterium]MCB9218929.1 peptidase [Ignavibacteriales bacterium]